ncbi:MAG: TonB-dependent receptor [Alphaproteobacteria bacterium]|nr:TonB-dependent receptor [Alphaproteobacteria bacterium]
MLNLKNNRLVHGRMMLGASVLALATVMGTSAALAQSTGGGMETVVVTGFKQSLEKALDLKRNALDSSDSILATDIAKFPDLNLSESLQRIPGVAISREAGEGQEISVRGLSPDFTRVRINGVEALATAGSSSVQGTNRGRAFDFNIFASDLFSAITVHKSASAELEEGSLGATVDLHTGHPFDHPGFVLTTSAQYGYNDLSGSSNPRFAALVSDTFMGGHVGVLVSAAYGIRNTLEDGWDTVRWMNDNTSPTTTTSASQQFKSVDGYTKTNDPNGTYAQINAGFHPRFPRYDLVTNHEKRLGLTGSVQWQPDDDTLFTLDGLFADYAMVRNEEYLEANSFSANFATKALGGTGTPVSLGLGNMDITKYTYNAATNNITSLTANGVGLRAEHFLANIDSRFEQLTLDGTHSFTDRFKVHGLMGWSESHMRNPVQTTLTYDYNGGLVPGSTTQYAGVTGYSYDYGGGYTSTPALKYGNLANSDGSVSSLSNWFLSQVRERADYNFNSYRTAIGDAEYDAYDWLTLKAGIDYKGYGYRTASLQRSNGSTANQDYVIPADMRAADLTKYSESVTVRGINAPAGSATTWMIPDLAKWNAAFNIWNPTVENGAFKFGIEPALSSNGSVHENDLGYWLQANWDSTFYGVPFRGDIGARYVSTDTESVGYSYDKTTGQAVASDVKQSYHDFLPALNAVFEPADNFLVRVDAAYTMARPGLTNMLPGASVSISGANRNVKVGNPYLQPYRSKNLDLAFEWYYHKGAMLSIAMFYKHIDSLVQSIAQDIPYAGNPFNLPNSLAVAACGSAYATPPSAGCNENAIWHFTTPVNSKGSPLYGTEINWQQPFDFLPHPLDNFGFLGNVTFVQAKQYYYNSDGTVNTYADLSGLSHTSYNATIYYDNNIFQARLSAAFRSKYLDGINPGNLNNILVTAATFNLDGSASYKYDDNFTITFDAINITNQAQNEYVDSVGQRGYVWHQTGREFFLGLRYNY